ncbi:MAG: hypothetical protein ACD_19C00140G0007 [uncultured bacterium]|nr:MAG: hypothetical protein ACD_19C00140G0007 [uncultured bacterium]
MQTFNGIGTTLYGRQDVNPDGSYIATKWFVLLYFPILPLGTYRVWSEIENISMPNNTVMNTQNPKIEYNYLSTTQRFKMEHIKLNWNQIFMTYILGAITLSIFSLAVWILSKFL